MMLQDRSGGTVEYPGRRTCSKFLAAARKRPELTGVRPNFSPAVPQLFAEVDKEKALKHKDEDTTRTGGTFLIEKHADPSAVWVRPSDPHTEWGAGQVKAESLKGSLLNDVHLAVATAARRTPSGW